MGFLQDRMTWEDIRSPEERVTKAPLRGRAVYRSHRPYPVIVAFTDIVGDDPSTQWPARPPYIVAYPILGSLSPGAPDQGLPSTRQLAAQMATGWAGTAIVLTADPSRRLDADISDRADGRFDRSARMQFTAGELAFDLHNAVEGTAAIPDTAAFMTQLRNLVESHLALATHPTRGEPRTLTFFRAILAQQPPTATSDNEYPRHHR